MKNQELRTLLQQMQALIDQQLANTPQGTSTERLLRFDEKEICKMPKTFKKEFRAQGCTAHVRKRTDGRYVCSYEIRYRRNGYNISVSAKTLQEAKDRFIEFLNNGMPMPTRKENEDAVPKTFNEFALYYFNKFRVRRVAERTMKEDLWRYKRYLYPEFGSMPIPQITSAKCQSLIDSIVEQRKLKTAAEVFSLLNVILKMAIRHEIIRHNPLEIVIVEKYEKDHGKALAREEERILLTDSAGTEYQLMFAVALYTGLRPNELETAKICGNMIIARNSKQKDGKEHTKRIPITPMLRPFLVGITELRIYKPEQLRKKLRAILPGHILKDLRKTFLSRCKECGVEEPAREEMMGHSLGALGNAYTELSDEYLLREAEKVSYDPVVPPNVPPIFTKKSRNKR